MTPEKADEMLARVEAGNFNAVFVNVFAYGHAYYESALLEKHPDLASDYDPLAHILQQAHQRGIAVHTWLVIGPVGFRGGPGPVLSEHPDWGLVGPDGRQNFWLNFSRPDVRQFIGDLVLEIVKNYDVDGVHFDYTRYPGPEWSFDPYSVQSFSQEYGTDLELLRYSELPAYATFRGNPLVGVNTAQVLAVFDSGRPAVLLNRYGAGEVILLNWGASERQVAVSSRILDRSISYLMVGSSKVYILRSVTNEAEYGSVIFENARAWLEDLDWLPVEIAEGDLATLDAGGVLVLPNVYLINDQVASDLADFVSRGGGVIFIDGPTPSIGNKNIQAITGMRTRGRHFERAGLLVAAQDHDIIPNSSREMELEEYLALDANWKTFRKQGINKLLQAVYQRTKPEAPEVLITITITSNRETLEERHFLDWQAWLDGEYVDLIIVRAYVDDEGLLSPIMADWQPVIGNSDRVILGLKGYSRHNGKNVPKTPEWVLSEIAQARAAGSQGILLFDMESTGDDVLEALAAGPFSSSNTTSD